MRFRREEVVRAKTLRKVGFPWRPKIGDWYVDPSGHCNLVRTVEEAEKVRPAADREVPPVKAPPPNVFLPGWDDCRAWLAERGWGHPEVMHEDECEVTMLLSHDDGRSLKVTGASDLDCLYRLILMVQLRTPPRDPPEEPT